MASIYKQKQKKQLRNAIICCALVFIMLASTIVISISHKMSFYQDFSDKNFASAIASALGLSSQYDLTQEDLDRFEGLVYFCSVGVDTATMQSYAYPVVMLCDKTYTDALMEQTDPDYEPTDEKAPDYSQNVAQVIYQLSDPTDLNLFRNLRMLRAFDISELSTMSEGCYQTQLYSMYGLGNTPYSLDTLIAATKLTQLTSLEQISSLKKLEQLSICYTGITTLDGIENFPNRALYQWGPMESMFNNALSDIYANQTKLQQVNRGGDLVLSGEISAYDQVNKSISSDGFSSMMQLKMTVKVKFENAKNPAEDFERQFSATREFDATQQLNDVQEELVTQIIDEIVEQIFNATVANW